MPATATNKPIVVVVTVEQGGFGDVGAAPVAREILVAVVPRQAGHVHGREARRRCEPATQIQPREEPRRPAARDLLILDPLLLLAGVGLVVCSLLTLKGRPPRDLLRRSSGALRRLWVLIALVLARFDYSRLREYQLGLYGMMIALNLVVFGMPAVHGRAALDPFPASSSSPRSSGRCC